MDIEIVFRKRGLPDNPPPTVGPITLQPGETFYAPNVLPDLFGITDITGFLYITADGGDVDPVAVAFNRISSQTGDEYGQAIPGITLDNLDAQAGGDGRQYLLGLSDNAERGSYFGLSNPHDQPAQYRLRAYDAGGNALGEPTDLRSLPRWGQKQFQIEEVRGLFPVDGLTDYRLEIEQMTGGTLYTYGGIVRLGTQDPAFVRVSVPTLPRTYLVGAASTPGFNNALFRTDAVVSNPTDQPMEVTVVYRNVGPNPAEPPVTVVLGANESRRLDSIILDAWGIDDGVGVLTLESAGAGGLYPMVHGETYQDSGPLTTYGLFMPARRESEAALPGESVVLTGLRQKDGESNTTLWLYNIGDQQANCDIHYRELDGTRRTLFDYRVGAGSIRQINPGALLLPEGGVDGGFSVEVVVKSGQVMAAGQVVINQSNDPAYVAGEVR
jgi:hypothetical protein